MLDATIRKQQIFIDTISATNALPDVGLSQLHSAVLLTLSDRFTPSMKECLIFFCFVFVFKLNQGLSFKARVPFLSHAGPLFSSAKTCICL